MNIGKLNEINQHSLISIKKLWCWYVPQKQDH